MKRLAFLVALLLAVATPVALAAPTVLAAAKKAPAKPKGPVNPLPEDGTFQGLTWGAKAIEVEAVLKMESIVWIPVPTGRSEYTQIAEVQPRKLYGMDGKAVMYSFRDDQLVAVTVALQNASTPVPLHDLMASLKTIYGSGTVAAMDEETHGIVVVFDTKTGAVVLFAAAPKDEIMSQVLFISAAEKARAEKQQDKKPEGSTPIIPGSQIKL